MRGKRPHLSVVRPRDAQRKALQEEIFSKASRLAGMSTDTEFTWFWNNLTNHLRNHGHLLPGDGRGGLIVPKREE